MKGTEGCLPSRRRAASLGGNHGDINQRYVATGDVKQQRIACLILKGPVVQEGAKRD